MKKLFYILVVLLLLPACKSKEAQRAGLQAATTKRLCGSRLVLERALAEADLVFHARALDTPEGRQEKEGFMHYVGRFAVLSVLKGEYKNSEFRVLYDCANTDLTERGIEEGEEVVVFVRKRPWFEATKIVPATAKVKGEIENLSVKHSDGWPRYLSAGDLWFVLHEPEEGEPGARATLQWGGKVPCRDRYRTEVYDKAKDNYPMAVVGRLEHNLTAGDSFEVEHISLKRNNINAAVKVYRKSEDAGKSGRVAYFGFYEYNLSLDSGEHRLTISFSVFAGKKDSAGNIKPQERFTEEFTFEVLKGDLCGSQMPLEEAAKEAHLIVHAESLTPQFLLIEEVGNLSGGGRFQVLSVLKGIWDKKEINVQYNCSHIQVRERAVKLGEEVILFIRLNDPGRSKIQAIKIVFATEEMTGRVRKLLGEHGTEPGKEK
jgi:hypothetical protein